MKKLLIVITAFLLTLVLNAQSTWLQTNEEHYQLYFKSSDVPNLPTYETFFANGHDQVVGFFKQPFKESYGIYVHTNRLSLDSAWQSDWNYPGFQSQCWMVASGISHKMDLISPVLWDTLSCEHSMSDTLAVQRLITHELIHVYHGQHNSSSDFSDVSGIDWFIEGLAVYASGQCDEERMREVLKAFGNKELPQKLDQFWKGNNKYGLSGSMMMYIDQTFGRDQLIACLRYNKLEDVLNQLEISEENLVSGWRDFMSNY